MKKSTFLFSFFVGAALLNPVLHAEEGQTTPVPEGDASAHQAQEPIYIASAQMGVMNPLPNAGFLNRLPGMSVIIQPAARIDGAPLAAAHLPVEILSDVTNYPNPFDSRRGGMDGKTVIAYQLAQDARTTITIYTLFGTKVNAWNFAPGDIGGREGVNTLPWDGTNEAGQKVSKGGYVAQIEVTAADGSFASATRKIGVIH